MASRTTTRKRAPAKRAPAKKKAAPRRPAPPPEPTLRVRAREAARRELGGHRADAVAVGLLVLAALTTLGLTSDLAGPVGRALPPKDSAPRSARLATPSRSSPRSSPSCSSGCGPRLAAPPRPKPPRRSRSPSRRHCASGSGSHCSAWRRSAHSTCSATARHSTARWPPCGRLVARSAPHWPARSNRLRARSARPSCSAGSPCSVRCSRLASRCATSARRLRAARAGSADGARVHRALDERAARRRRRRHAT